MSHSHTHKTAEALCSAVAVVTAAAAAGAHAQSSFAAPRHKFQKRRPEGLGRWPDLLSRKKILPRKRQHGEGALALVITGISDIYSGHLHERLTLPALLSTLIAS